MHGNMGAVVEYGASVQRDVFYGHGVEVTLPEPDAFLKVKETLTRVGYQTQPGVLDQPCFILHKRGQYAIVHHLELLQLDGSDVWPEDVGEALATRNTIASLLEQWGLVEIVDPRSVQAPRVQVGRLKIVPFKAKSEWKLNPLYHIGRKR
jgi:hypothetical protein